MISHCLNSVAVAPTGVIKAEFEAKMRRNNNLKNYLLVDDCNFDFELPFRQMA